MAKKQTKVAAKKQVAIIMGSQSDWQTMQHAAATLDQLQVGYEALIVSAHRTPERLFKFARTAKASGYKVIIAGAGGAAHLPGMAASLTPLPVFGVPMNTTALEGKDSLLSILQMPAGIPVGTLAIGKPGAINAALLAASVIALSDAKVAKRVDAYRAAQTSAVGKNRNKPIVLKPEATIGILGGGQLGRMLALAAARLGLRCHVFSSEKDACSFQVVERHTLAEFSDEAALEKFAADCDTITYEFENVPAKAAAFLAARKPVFPDPKVLATTQDRLIEKQFVTSLGIATAPFAPVGSAAEAMAAAKQIGLPAVLKTRRLGYDGKGQIKIAPGDNPAKAWESLGKAECILEGFVAFEREVSVVAARSRDGVVECFDLTENEHRDHILYKSTVPARVPDTLVQEARRIAERIADAFQYVGVFAVEMFVVKGERGHALLVNEIAPRVHNSGHWTLDGATVSQFEQHMRAVAGWQLGKPLRHARVEMTNLIGPEVHDAARWLAMPGTTVHLYGKGEARGP